MVLFIVPESFCKKSKICLSRSRPVCPSACLCLILAISFECSNDEPPDIQKLEAA